MVNKKGVREGFIYKNPDSGRDWRQEENRENRNDRGWDDWMASQIQWTWVWVNSGSWWWQGGLACCSLLGHKESDRTERLNWTEVKRGFHLQNVKRKVWHIHNWTRSVVMYKTRESTNESFKGREGPFEKGHLESFHEGHIWGLKRLDKILKVGGRRIKACRIGGSSKGY